MDSVCCSTGAQWVWEQCRAGTGYLLKDKFKKDSKVLCVRCICKENDSVARGIAVIAYKAVGSGCNCCLFHVLSPESSGPYNCENSAWNSGAVNWPQDLTSSLCNSFAQAFREPSYWQRQWTLLEKIYWYFVIQLMKQIPSFGLISVAKWQSMVCRRISVGAQLPRAASPSTACRKFPSLFLLSATLLTETEKSDSSPGGHHTGGFKAALGEGACFPGLRWGRASSSSIWFHSSSSKTLEQFV